MIIKLKFYFNQGDKIPLGLFDNKHQHPQISENLQNYTKCRLLWTASIKKSEDLYNMYDGLRILKECRLLWTYIYVHCTIQSVHLNIGVKVELKN